MDTRGWVEILMGATVPIGVIGIIAHRIWTRKGLSVRSIQLMAVVTLVPTIAVLALEKVLEGAAVGTIFGGLAGYLLSGISDYDKQKGDSDA